jgi:hypothetical protein
LKVFDTLATGAVWRQIIVAGDTFLSLIPLLTEEEVPYVASIPCTTANLPVILWVILDLRQKALSTVENNSGCLSTGLPP